MSAGLDEIGDLLRDRRPPAGPLVVGVTGSVAVGKSRFARELAATLGRWPERPLVEIVGTDGFLFANAELDARGLTMRKGFPESYDMAALRAALAAIRIGPASFPGYSHTIYDVDPGLARRLDSPDALIIEGLALQDGAERVGLDALVYLDAEEADIEAWFADRFIQMWSAAETDPTSFYVRFRHLSETEARSAAVQVWRAINLPNLREHIVAGRALADIVVRKNADHAVRAIIPQRTGK
jgi:type I pantothenate kinase